LQIPSDGLFFFNFFFFLSVNHLGHDVIFVIDLFFGRRHTQRLGRAGWVERVGRDFVCPLDHGLDVTSLLQGFCVGEIACELAEHAA
jgi:hypothetical protein